MGASRKGILTRGRGEKKGKLKKYMVAKKIGNAEEKETKSMEKFKITAE